MQSNLKIFEFNNKKIRIENINNEAYFCSIDICNILEYKNNTKAIRDNCEQDGLTTGFIIDTIGRKQKTTFINEANLLRLIMKSTMPQAKVFQNWVCADVLPQIRKTGSYNAVPQHTLPATYIEALEALVVIEKEKQTLLIENKEKQELLDKQAPQIEKYNQLHNAEGEFCLQDAMKMLHLHPNRAIDRLCQLKYIYNNNRRYSAYQKYIDSSLFTIKTVVNDNIKYGTYITAKGLAYFREILHKFNGCKIDEYKYNPYLTAKQNEFGRIAFKELQNIEKN
jgi:prophage antirepressor-like protein